jgi:hypothetical protein
MSGASAWYSSIRRCDRAASASARRARRLQARELGALAVEVGLHDGLAALEAADSRLERPDAGAVGADLRGQDPLGPLPPADPALGRLDLVLEVGQAALRRGPVGGQRERGPQRQRERRTGEKHADPHRGARC